MKMQLAALVLGCMGLVAGSDARAQVALDQFKPAPLASDGFALSRPDVLAPSQWGALVMLDYANDPLVFKTTRDREVHVVEHQLVLHVGAAFALGERITAFGMLPIDLVMQGDDAGAASTTPKSPVADGAGLGDASLGGRLLIYGDAATRFQLAGEFIARLPTARLAASAQTYAGDRVGSYEPALIGELHFSRVDMRLRGGVRLREPDDVGDLRLGTELVYGYGLRVRLADNLYAHGELYGANNFAALSKAAVTPIEALLGLKYGFASYFVGAAAGPGLKWGDLGGYGSPDVRAIATLGYAPVAKAKPQPPQDSDGDGLLDPADSCPRDPEDKDQFADEDGCPDPDNDRDGVLDAADQCVLDPEDQDGFEDTNGCPDLDNDADGLVDAHDECPVKAEDQDAYRDSDGCPDPDNDHDGVLDADDQCPLVPGVIEAHGCMPTVRVDVEKGQIVILDRVEFATNKDVILEQSVPLLEQVQKTISDNPQLKKIRVEGHTDDVGRATRNLELSKRRARSVARWLIGHGVDAARLEAYGCGQTRPLVANDSDETRQKNRRVEFHIADPAPPDAPGVGECRRMDVH